MTSPSTLPTPEKPARLTDPVRPVTLALRPKEAARALGISDRLLWSLTNRKLIPHVRVGARIIYPLDVLSEWLAKQAAGKGGGNG